MADWDESKHSRADDGKFGSGPGSAGAAPKADPVAEKRAVTQRAKDALKDKAFVDKHKDRILDAVEQEKAKHPPDQHAQNEVHEKIMAEAYHEAERIHREEESIAGPHEARLRSAVDSMIVTGTPDERHERVMARVAEEASAIADEKSAIDAGHVSPIPEDKLNAHMALASEAKTIADDLDVKQRDALTAVANFEAAYQASLTSDDDNVGEPALDEGLLDSIEVSSTALSDALGRDEQRQYDVEPIKEYPGPLDAPDEPDEDDDLGEWNADQVRESEGYTDEEVAAGSLDRAKEEHEQAVLRYKDGVEAVANFKKEHEERIKALKPEAEQALTALEELHDQQSAALERAQAIREKSEASRDAMLQEIADAGGDDDSGLVKASAFPEDSQNEDGGYDDPELDATYQRAQSASASMIADSKAHREDISLDISTDTIAAMKNAVKATAAAAKKVSKFADRAPKIRSPKAKAVLAKAKAKGLVKPKRAKAAAKDDTEDDEEEDDDE